MPRLLGHNFERHAGQLAPAGVHMHQNCDSKAAGGKPGELRLWGLRCVAVCCQGGHTPQRVSYHRHQLQLQLQGISQQGCLVGIVLCPVNDPAACRVQLPQRLGQGWRAVGC
jgi:hypothetical protein